MKTQFIIFSFFILLQVKLQAESFSDLLSNINPTNNIEQNYLNYYNLFANIIDQREAEESIPDDDLNALYNLAQLCPAESGSCVHQARALYNSIYRQVINYSNCGESAGRAANSEVSSPKKVELEKKWDVDLFPNPAQTILNIVNKNEVEMLIVTITDLSGRILLTQNLTTNNKLAHFRLDLLNGAYFITINNSKNEKVVKKLLIAK